MDFPGYVHDYIPVHAVITHHYATNKPPASSTVMAKTWQMVQISRDKSKLPHSEGTCPGGGKDASDLPTHTWLLLLFSLLPFFENACVSFSQVFQSMQMLIAMV